MCFGSLVVNGEGECFGVISFTVDTVGETVDGLKRPACEKCTLIIKINTNKLKLTLN